MSPYYYAIPLVGIAVWWAAAYLLRRAADVVYGRRQVTDGWKARENLIASLKLQLPPNAQLVMLEHTASFNDVRNRDLAADVLRKSGFETSTAETHEGRKKFWLLGRRSAMVEKVPDELARVADFAAQYGGTYVNVAAKL